MYFPMLFLKGSLRKKKLWGEYPKNSFSLWDSLYGGVIGFNVLNPILWFYHAFCFLNVH